MLRARRQPARAEVLKEFIRRSVSRKMRDKCQPGGRGNLNCSVNLLGLLLPTLSSKTQRSGSRPQTASWRRLFVRVTLDSLAALAVLLFGFLKDSIIRAITEHRTGLEVSIGRLSSRVLSPTLTIENLKLYNTAEFGGACVFDCPRASSECDPRLRWLNTSYESPQYPIDVGNAIV